MILQGRLLTDPDERPRPGWVRVSGGLVAELGAGAPPAAPDAGEADSVVCPGFTDAHLHLPQADAIGCEHDDLLTWLDEVVYPAELRWSSPAWAAAQVRSFTARMLAAGTTGYAGYLSSHPDGLEVLQREHRAAPLRAVVGQSLMDRNAPGALLGHRPAPRPAPSARLAFSVNPRFAYACTEALLEHAGREAGDGAFVQTHLAEQRRECQLVRALFPDDPHYAGVYDRFGLLTERALVAHCLHLGEDEWSLLAERRCVVVHCPAANIFLRSGLFDLDAARRHGVRLALGSDVAAGPDLAMPRVARAMIEVAKVRAMTGGQTHVPRPADAWRLITEGNADALGMTEAGRLAPGAAADLLVLKPPFAADEHLIGRLLYTWRDEYITHRILAGQLRTL